MSVQRYSWDSDDGWEFDSLGEYVKASDYFRLERELAEARETLQFVERWANHHGVKPRFTPAEALGVIQHHPDIVAITDSYVDGKRPETRNPYAEIAELRAKGSQLPSLKEIKDAVRESGFATHEQCWQIANDVLAMLSARPQQPKGESNVE